MDEIYFELSGVPVRLASSSPPLAAIFADYFRYYTPQAAAPGLTPAREGLTVTMEIAPDLPPPERFAPAGAEFMAESGSLRMWREDPGGRERFYFHAGVAAYRVEPGRGRLEAFIGPAALDASHLLANTYTLFPLLLLLRARSRYHLHAAAVISPRDRLYLICEGPRAGKSTLTAALGLAGWKPIADDSLFLHEDGGEARLSAFKRDFHLGLEVLGRWPELSGAAKRYFYHDRAAVAGLEFFGARELAEAARSRVDAVIFPQITGEGQSRLEPLPAGEALLTLAEQSLFFPLWREHTARHFDLLARLSRGAAFYRLLAGTEILAEPRSPAQVLEELG
jgi:hypothetical protein